MAARNDQTTQIAVIVLSIVTVILLGFTYWFYKSSSDSQQRIAELEQQRSSDQNTAREFQTENETYRQYMGFGQFDNFETVQTQFQADMEKFGSTFSEQERAYRKILDYVYDESIKIAREAADSKEREKQLKAQMANFEAERDAQIKNYVAQLQKVEQDAASERTAFNAARADLETKQQQLATTLAEQRTAFETQISESNAKVAEIQEQLDNVERSRTQLLAEREQQSESFEVADGRVTWVNQANQTAWINLGEADSLRRQITFSVFDSTESDAAKTEKKGSIEVTRILGDHMAEARITSDDPRNPIMPGDNIHTPLWHRGRQVHFALTGIVDLDGDGRSDMQQARDLIALNGGEVDSYVNDEGAIEGEMSIETRYLVLGEHPKQPSQSAEREAWDVMSQSAANLGVETITLHDFMNQMGYQTLDRTVRMGAGARGDDFPPPAEDSSSSRFRPRSPYVPLRTPLVPPQNRN